MAKNLASWPPTVCRILLGTNSVPRLTKILADEAMRDLVLPLLTEEPKILEDVTSTWKIENWRAFQSKKEHGPIFHAGGFPWYVEYTLP